MGEDGKVIFIIPEGRDITDRKRSEEELAKYHAHLEDVVRERTAELKESEERFRAFFNAWHLCYRVHCGKALAYSLSV